MAKPLGTGSQSEILEILGKWIDRVAAAILALLDEARRSRLVQIAEQKDGTFRVVEASQKGQSSPLGETFRVLEGRVDSASAVSLAPVLRGARVDLRLDPGRFLVRPLEFPLRAEEFLAGIIRSQIDRLTPWSAADAVFGWSAPVEVAGRMVVSVAATGRGLIMPIVQAISDLGADAVRVTVPVASPAGNSEAAVEVLTQKSRAAREIHLTRRILVGVLAVTAVAAILSLVTDTFLGADLEARQDDLSRRITRIRASLTPEQDSASEAAVALLRRKQENPSSVMIIDSLAKNLPDHTFVTELRIQDDKVQISGMTQDAPSLVRLLEQTSVFSEASFFAPTTRSPAKPGENFHIEAKLKPLSTPIL